MSKKNCDAENCSNVSNASGGVRSTETTKSVVRPNCSKWQERILPIMIAALITVGAISVAGYLTSQSRMPENIGYELSGDQLQEVVDNNSSMIEYAFLSPNADFPRSENITTITIHHTGAELSLEQVGNIFSKRDRQSSANYGIDRDGKVGMFVEEKNRSWATGSAASDQKSVTIEVANDKTGGEWHVSDEAYASLIDLIVDICKRNGISELIYTGDDTGTLIAHNVIDDSTQCPGPYLTSKLPDIANEANERLSE